MTFTARSAKPQDLQQTYPAVADSVPAARCTLTRFAAQAGASAVQIEALRLAATEALTNVVKHAYRGRTGSIRLTAAVACDELCVLIADDGCGIRPHLRRGGLGLGLTLIASQCDQVQIVKRAHGGTELRLWFVLAPKALTSDGQLRGSLASADAPARSRFSTTTQPAPEMTSVSSPETS